MDIFGVFNPFYTVFLGGYAPFYTIREKMQDSTSDAPLFPLIAQQRYNEYIKEVFKACGITREVSVINPTTGEVEQKSIIILP